MEIWFVVILVLLGIVEAGILVLAAHAPRLAAIPVRTGGPAPFVQRVEGGPARDWRRLLEFSLRHLLDPPVLTGHASISPLTHLIARALHVLASDGVRPRLLALPRAPSREGPSPGGGY